jgi:hypothetical protein
LASTTRKHRTVLTNDPDKAAEKRRGEKPAFVGIFDPHERRDLLPCASY